VASDRDDPEPRRMIYDIRRRVQAARNQYWAEGVDSNVSERTHRELAVATLQYYDVLYEFRDESVLTDNDWPDINELRDRVGKTVTKRTHSGVFGETTTTNEVPAVTMLPADRIVTMSKDLDDLAKRLGFSATADSSTDVFGIDPEWDDGDGGDDASTAD